MLLSCAQSGPANHWQPVLLLLCSAGLFLCSLHTVHDEEKPFELELAWICLESNKKFQRVPADLAQEADRAAKDALNSDM